MFTFVLSVVAAILAFFLTDNYLYFFITIIGLYYLFRKESKAETFTALNLILISAIALFGKFRPYSQDGLNFVIYGAFLSVLYDIFKKWYYVIPMFFLTGIGISLISSIKFGKVGYFFGLILIPVVLREYSLQKKLSNENKTFSGGEEK
ncbi:MAG: hypothetical protein ABDH59_04265 [Fervidobacterium sp.]